RRLVTLGQLIDGVLHDGRPLLLKIGNQTEDGIMLIQQQESQFDCEDKLTQLSKILETIDKHKDRFGTIFNRIEPFGGRRSGRPVEVIFEDIIRDSVEVVEGDLQRANIQVQIPTTQNIVTVDTAEIQEVFVNLIQNSIYWLDEIPND